MDEGQLQQMMQAMQMQQMVAGMGDSALPLPTQPLPGVDNGSLGAPAVDPAMFVYAQMFQHFQQQQQSQGGLPGLHGMPPIPFPTPALAPLAVAPAEKDAKVAVSVEGMRFQYQLTDDDLLKVFSTYGQVKAVRIATWGSTSCIIFEKVSDAERAIEDLDGKHLSGLGGTLRVTWAASFAPIAPAAWQPWVPRSPEAKVAVSVEGMRFQYELTYDDLRKVFSTYGQVKAVRIATRGSTSYIIFEKVSDAERAIEDLDGKYLSGVEGTLRVTWAAALAPTAPAASPPQAAACMPFMPGLPSWPGVSNPGWTNNYPHEKPITWSPWNDCGRPLFGPCACAPGFCEAHASFLGCQIRTLAAADGPQEDDASDSEAGSPHEGVHERRGDGWRPHTAMEPCDHYGGGVDEWYGVYFWA